ncbi:MAG: TIGR01777 family oxidoreductase [Capsulimonadales bacterium]|nr:TIGR01777 family oxidoreductase [Capsulimonadales bacterium]
MDGTKGMKGTKGTIVVPGGAGFLGRVLREYFSGLGYRVIVLSRGASGSDVVRWDGENPGDWEATLRGAAAVINLAGRTVNCRYNEKNREEIYESRLKTTKALGDAISRCADPPPVWINSSSATIYRHAEDRPMDEATGEIGSGFSVDVCRKWEAALFAAETPRTRKVALRSAMVFGPGEEGVHAAFRRIVRIGLGGTLGNGRQYVSWIHDRDFVRAVHFLLERDDLSGPVNLASPNPLPNAEFMRIFRRVCRRPIGLPATRWMLEIGALLLQTETELLLKSRRVVPGKLRDAGFRFDFPEWEAALSDIVSRETKR